MVVTFLPPTAEICVWQDLTALPSIWTVQAPQRPEPHPYLVPVSLRCSRTTQSSAVSGSASTFTVLPLIVNATAVGFLPGTVNTCTRRTYATIEGRRQHRHFLLFSFVMIRWHSSTDTPQKLPRNQEAGKWHGPSATRISKPAPL